MCSREEIYTPILIVNIHTCRDQWEPLKTPQSQRYTEEAGQPHLENAASTSADGGCPSLTISCFVASAPQQHSSGRCSSFSGGCSTHGPEEVRFRQEEWERNMQQELRQTTNRFKPSYLRPVIAGGVCKDVAVVIEATSCDWLVQLLRGL